MIKRYVRCFVVLGAFLGSVWLDAPDVEAKSFKIGAIFSLAGKFNSPGEAEWNAATMLAEEINAQGGVNGYPIELLRVDDETLANKAVIEAKRLIETEDVLAIVGPTTSGISLQVKPVCEAAKVPMVCCAAAEAIVTPPESSRYTFKTPQLDSHVAIRLIEYIKGKGITKIAVLTERTSFGEHGARQIETRARDAGMEVVATETYKTGDTSMKTQLRKIRDSGAGAIINWAAVPTQTLVPKNMKELGIKIPLFASHGFGNPKFASTAGEAGEGMIFPASLLLVVDELRDDHPQKKLLMRFKTAYEKRFGTPVTAFGGYAYDALSLVVNAMRSAGVAPNMGVAKARELIRDGLEQTKGWVGVTGVFNMSPTDHTGLDKQTSLGMLVLRGGKFSLLDKTGTGN